MECEVQVRSVSVKCEECCDECCEECCEECREECREECSVKNVGFQVRPLEQ